MVGSVNLLGTDFRAMCRVPHLVRLLVVTLCVTISVCTPDMDDPEIIATAIRRIIEGQTKIYNDKMEKQQQRSKQRFQALEGRLQQQEQLLVKLKADVSTLRAELESCNKDSSLNHKSVSDVQHEGSTSNGVKESSTETEDTPRQHTEHSADVTEQQPAVEGKDRCLLRARSKAGQVDPKLPRVEIQL